VLLGTVPKGRGSNVENALREFKDFVAKGNVIDLAVAVVVGGLILAVVQAVVDGVIEPFIAMIFGEPNFNDVLSFTINDSTFRPGLIITAVILLVVTGAVVFFGIVRPYEHFRHRPDPTPTGPTQEELLTQIRDLLARR
jgi:large conductance mechanosensitive channel